MARFYSVTNEAYKKRKSNITLRFGFHPTPFGECLIAISQKGISALRFVDKSEKKEAVNEMMNEWDHSAFLESPGITRSLAERIFYTPAKGNKNEIELFVKGTPFQIKVWKELLRIPYGSVISYQEIAKRIGLPRAARAAGNAIAQNPVAFLIPCHRVIRKSGDIGKYRWGREKKKELLRMENSSQND